MVTKKPTASKTQSEPVDPKPTKTTRNLKAVDDIGPTTDTEAKTTKHQAKKSKKVKKPRTTKQKMLLAGLIFTAIVLIGGTVAAVILLLTHKDELSKAERPEYTEPIYSILTGEEIASEELNSSPSYCVQIPNGSTDGARPQAGLNQAGVVFEAIAERGITRFAAVFQNATVSAIGPVRSLRPYYLDWDTPFDCTIVHAGGSDEAIAGLNMGGQRNLDESLEYMWREDSDRYWNNLFTSPADITKFNNDMGYRSSDIKAFPRYTPDENDEILAQIKTCEAENAEGEEYTECIPTALVDNVTISFGSIPMYNTVYQYDLESNRYLRSYASGEAHMSYECPSDLNQPDTKTECGEPVQVAPRVVVAMFVYEDTASDGYHEEINTINSGSALIFQNGDVAEATWSKTGQGSQITFRNAGGEEFKFAPGQVWIAAVPQYGNVGF